MPRNLVVNSLVLAKQVGTIQLPMISFNSRRVRRPKQSVRRAGIKIPARLSGKVRFTKQGSWWSFLWHIAKRAVVIGVVAGIVYVVYLWATLPSISDPQSFLAAQSTVITDRNDVELYRLFQEENRTYINDSLIPDVMRKAIISIEDERFYDRGCLDIIALGRAVVYAGRAGGASTLTRQLARNALSLKHENILNRKLKELALGCQMESVYTKDEILGLYLNWIPFGENAYGVEQASKTYFGHSAQELTLPKSAILASLPKGPSYYSPYGRRVRTQIDEDVVAKIINGSITRLDQVPDEAVTIGLLGNTIGSGSNVLYIGGRTDQVLKNMEDQGYVSASERQAALDELAVIEFESSRESIRAPHFVLWVREQVEELLADQIDDGVLERGGLTITTTLDWELQQIAEAIVEEKKEDTLTRFGAHNISLLSVDPSTRDVLAYVGNMDYGDTENGGKIDMIQVPRQPGSSFKPLVYLSAFNNGYSPATVLYDVQTRIGNDQPQNFDADFMGPMTIRAALGASRNIPAAKAFFLGGGEDEILDLVSDLGAPTPKQRRADLVAERGEFEYGWPLSLGAAETPMYEMVQAYSTLADRGRFKALHSIETVTDKEGNILYQADKDVLPKQVVDERLAYQITDILSDAEARPDPFWSNQLAVPGFASAAKTGTSNKCLEYSSNGSCRLRKPDNAWLMGYTPALVTGVWVGNADNSAMFDRAGGLNSASPIWKEYMARAHRTLESPATTFTVPTGISSPQVSRLSGLLPADCTPVDFREPDIFLSNKIPTELDTACQIVEVDKLTGLLASDTCPVEAREERAFFVPRSILPERWPLWEQGVQEWAAKQRLIAEQIAESGTGELLLPLPFIPSESCDPALTPGRLEKPEFTIVSPVSIATYPAFTVRLNLQTSNQIQEIRYEIDGKVAATDTSEPFDGVVRVPRSINKNTSHTLTVTVIDEYFNSVSNEQTIRFGEDTNEPEVEITLPRPGAIWFTGDEVTVTANASDPDGGIRFVQFYLNEALLSTRPSSPYTLTFPLEAEPGSYTLKAVATDFAENEVFDIVPVTILGAESKELFDGLNGGAVVEPVIISPAEDSIRHSTREILTILFTLPNFADQNITNATLVVQDDVTKQSTTIYSIDRSTGGVLTQSWRPTLPGNYTLRLSGQTNRGESQVWSEKSIIVR